MPELELVCVICLDPLVGGNQIWACKRDTCCKMAHLDCAKGWDPPRKGCPACRYVETKQTHTSPVVDRARERYDDFASRIVFQDLVIRDALSHIVDPTSALNYRMRSHSVLAFAVIISFAVFYSMWHLDIYLQNNVTSNDGQLHFEHFKMLVASMIIALCTSSVSTFIIMAFAGRCDLDVETGPLFGIISIAGLIGVCASSHRLLNQYLMDLTK